MAIIKCPECGNDISDKAFSCPNCGCPVSSNENWKLAEISENKKKEKAKENIVIVKEKAKDNVVIVKEESGCLGCSASVIISLFFVFLLAAYIATNTDTNTKTDFEPPTDCVPVTVNQMRDDLNDNAVKAQSTYKNKWFEISGILGTIDSDGYYFYLREDDYLFSTFSVRCKIPSEKRNIIIDKLEEKHHGQRVTVKGKVTDMGETMGYEVTIVDIY